ncbi:hypothetical protein LSAT2_000087, partial [Lamellibrachia satsuma]
MAAKAMSRTEEPKSYQSEHVGRKEMNKTNVDVLSTFYVSWQEKHSIQLMLVVLMLYFGRRISTYAVTCMHAQRARHLWQTYDAHRTELDSLVSRFVCYDDQSEAWRDIVHRLCPHARLSDGSHNGEQRGDVNGLNLITDIDRNDRERDQADDEDEVGQTHEDVDRNDTESDQVEDKIGQTQELDRNDTESYQANDKVGKTYEDLEKNDKERDQVEDKDKVGQTHEDVDRNDTESDQVNDEIGQTQELDRNDTESYQANDEVGQTHQV